MATDCCGLQPLIISVVSKDGDGHWDHVILMLLLVWLDALEASSSALPLICVASSTAVPRLGQNSKISVVQANAS